MTGERDVIGLIAGQGRLPLLVAGGIRAAGARVCAVGLRGHFDPVLPGLCDRFATVGVLRIGSWVRLLRRGGVSNAVLVGRVKKGRQHDPLRLFRQIPDWRAARLWYRTLRHDRRTPAVLGALADDLARNGITLLDSTSYVTDHLASAGVLTQAGPTDAQAADVAFGATVLRRVIALDIGQSIAVNDGKVIAVEAVEGTDELIDRAGSLAPPGWTLLKSAKAGHDMRFDVPTVGPMTIERMARAGAGCAALGVGRVIMLDRPETLGAADRAGIAVVGIG